MNIKLKLEIKNVSEEELLVYRLGLEKEAPSDLRDRKEAAWMIVNAMKAKKLRDEARYQAKLKRAK